MVMEPMEQALRVIEAHAEDKLGWDARPMFLVLAGDPLTGVGMVSVELPEFVYINPGDGLPLFLEILTNRDLGPVGDLMRAHLKAELPPAPLLGIVLINEAWSVRANSREEMETIKVSPSRHPDRVEIRMGTLVTVDGRVLVIERERGGPVRFHEVDVTNGYELRGRVPDSLRRLIGILETLASEHAK